MNADLSPQGSTMEAVDEVVDDIAPRLDRVYVDLHQNPELGFQEHRTAGVVAERFTALGMETTPGVGGTGVVGILRNGDGPTVLVRGDMDALPLLEKTGLAYASTASERLDGRDVPVMHACGHDVHTTSLMGTAEVLTRLRDQWSGTVVAMAQPAEELLSGARAMLDDGLFERFGKPDVAVAQHTWAGPLGTVFHRAGDYLASCDNLDIVVHGVGGHGSRPEATVDPVQTAAWLTVRLHGLVGREVAASDAAVVTVGSVQAGHTYNVVPDEARLKVTVRTYDPAVRERVLAAIERVTHRECDAAGCPKPPTITFATRCSATVNDPEVTEAVARAHRGLVGDDAVLDKKPEMGSEDFGELGAAGVPSTFYFFGVMDPSLFSDPFDTSRVPYAHSPEYAPMREAVPVGTRLLTAATLELLHRPWR
jgi:amidohydrolase